jgi:hypothetical protein
MFTLCAFNGTLWDEGWSIIMYNEAYILPQSQEEPSYPSVASAKASPLFHCFSCQESIPPLDELAAYSRLRREQLCSRTSLANSLGTSTVVVLELELTVVTITATRAC